MKRILLTMTIISALLTQTACSKSDDPAPTPNYNVNFMANLTGASEVPANPSTASGMSMVTFNSQTKILTATTTYTGVTATAAHIHKGATTVSGPVIFGFSNVASPISYTSVALDATQEADLMANQYYVNVHSAAYPGGEIRGQLIKQ
ncbi:MAG: hypothetical protein JWQ27_2504 [Ferruginibacter sp.]|nr:hypothetical protein [Ferruginibacter sp.]